MTSLPDIILEDKEIQKLIKRVEDDSARLQVGCINIAGYTRDGPERQVTEFYSSREEYKKKFTEEKRLWFNGRIVEHEYGIPRYVCHTNIEETEKGEGWILAGNGTKGDKIKEKYGTKQDLNRDLEDVLKKMRGKAVIHQIGTSVYHVIEVKTYLDLLALDA